MQAWSELHEEASHHEGEQMLEVDWLAFFEVD
jgi:hypothetical protein